MADICRIPWMRLRLEIFPYETSFIFDMKWQDWLYSMQLSEKCGHVRNCHTQHKHDHSAFSESMVIALQKQAKNNLLYQLSSDMILGNKINCIANEADRFLNDYKS